MRIGDVQLTSLNAEEEPELDSYSVDSIWSYLFALKVVLFTLCKAGGFETELPPDSSVKSMRGRLRSLGQPVYGTKNVMHESHMIQTNHTNPKTHKNHTRHKLCENHMYSP